MLSVRTTAKGKDGVADSAARVSRDDRVYAESYLLLDCGLEKAKV